LKQNRRLLIFLQPHVSVVPDANRVRLVPPGISPGDAPIHVAQKEDVAMRTYDLSALWRSTVGFERLLNRMNDAANDGDSYPLYDVERAGEDQYRISMALPGFTPNDIALTVEPDKLTVEGRKANRGVGEFLYQGIPMRPFRRVFNLAKHVQVKGANVENGMLTIVLVREVPEAMKPRRIAIGVAGNDNPNIEHNQAA